MIRGLLVGINEYKNSDNNLRGTKNDVEDFKRSFSMDSCVTLLDDQATKNSILDKLEKSISLLRSGDIFYFYFSGHGSHVRDKNNDEDNKVDEVLCPYDFNMSTYISDDMLVEIFNKGSKNILIECFFDCCHSGTLIDGQKEMARFVPTIFSNFYHQEKKFVKEVAQRGKVIAWGACGSYQVSMETWIKGKIRGAFTYCLCGVHVNDKRLNRRHLYQQLCSTISALGFKQSPQLEDNY